MNAKRSVRIINAIVVPVLSSVNLNITPIIIISATKPATMAALKAGRRKETEFTCSIL
jgi:hypothetical protein